MSTRPQSGKGAQRPAWPWRLPATPAGIVLLVTLGWGANIGLRTSSGAPLPVIHDEFSYLLAADTFAHGRLTNPKPQLPAFFETFHVLTQPTRASKYPPGQGLVLAVGQRLGGHPFLGVWLGGWLFCLATAWMVRAFAPPRWAAAAALLAVLHPQAVDWGLRYWGGLLGAGGGAIVVGAIARLHRDLKWRHALALSVGASVLALTRPFEGFVLCALAILSLVVRRRHPWRRLLVAGLAPALIGLAPLVGFQLAYNSAVTGHPLVMPYSVYQRAHLQTPAFLWENIDTNVVHRHKAMATFEKKWIKRYNRQHTLEGFLEVKGRVVRILADRFLVRGAALLPVVGVLIALGLARRRRARRVTQTAPRDDPGGRPRAPRDHGLAVGALLLVTCVAVLIPETFGHNHYVPWGLPAAVLLAISASRMAGALVRSRRAARVAYGAVMVAAALVSERSVPQRMPPELKARFTTEERLLKAEGAHVVFVRYGKGHSPYNEWVYNPADLDTARVLFVRDLGKDNTKLMALMPHRTAWRASVSPDAQTLEPLGSAAGSAAGSTRRPATTP